MSKIWVSPTGNVIRGHVLDCSVGPLVERLRDIDSRLYVRWNPKKLRGWGCWEVRIRPLEKTIQEVVTYGGDTYVVVDYVENNFENHILDCAFLNYGILSKLREMDTWAVSNDTEKFASEMDYRDRKAKEKIKDDAKSERNYAIKQHRSMVRDLMDYTLSGGDPSLISHYWPKG